MRRIIALLAALLFAAPAGAQVIGSGIFGDGKSGGVVYNYAPILVAANVNAGVPSATALNYATLSPAGFTVNVWASTAAAKRAYVPLSAMTLYGLVVHAETTVATGSYTITLFKNDVATALQCYVDASATNNTCVDTADFITAAAGDYLYLVSCPTTGTPPCSSSPTGTPTASILDISLMARSAPAVKETPIWSVETTASATVQSFGGFGNITQTSIPTPDTAISSIVPNGHSGSGTVGTIDQLYAYAVSSPTAGKSFAMEIYKNGASTGLTCTIDNTHNPCTPDLTHSLTVVAGDTLSVSSTPTGTPGATNIITAVRWRSSITTGTGEYPLFGLSGVLPPTASSNRFWNIGGYSGTGASTEGTTNIIVPPVTNITFKGMEAAVSTDPTNAGSSRTYTLRSGTSPSSQSSSPNVTCAIANGATGCAPSALNSLTVNGSSVATPQYMNWLQSIGTTAPVAITWAKTSLIAVVTP